MSTLFAKLRVVVGALPTWLSALTAVLTVVGTELVPLLPGGWPVQAGGWVVVALAWLRVTGEVVARLTTVLPDQRGVLSPPGTRVETVTVIEAPDRLRRMRHRLVAAVVLAALTVAGCDSSQPSPYHFARTSGSQTVVYLVNGHYNPQLDAAFVRAANTWSWNAHLEVRHVRSCPALQNCIHVQLEDLPYYLGLGGITGFIDSTHAHTGTVTIDWPWPAGQNLAFAACHEVGHALGLAHGVHHTGDGDDGPCDYTLNYPTDLDQRNIDSMYSHRDNVGPAGL